ncbi:MAG: MBL fold metallo-hydrolase [Chloroflexota bacterium]|nr:MBL fold metallo-hydrolase [Chloroflexota bacterium]
MAQDITLTIVYDNDPYTPGLKTAWGFGCFIEGMEKTILFDTGGDAPTLLSNMSALDIEPQQVEVVVLSHIHADHTGGLEGFLQRNAQVTVWAPASFPQRFDTAITRQGADMVRIHKPQSICEGVYSTGEMGRSIAEQALILDTKKGVVVITGCAHPGVADMVARAHEVVEGELLFVVGGFHLGSASRQQIEGIISRFRDMDVQYVGPTHCSGEMAKRLFREEYGDHYLDVGVGRVIRLEDLN